MTEKKIGFFQEFFSSVSGSYKELAKQTFGKAMGYLLIVGLLLGTVHAVKFFIDGQHNVRIWAKAFAKNSPDFTFANGLLSVDAEMPIVIKDSDSVVVIDTSDEADESILDNYEEGFLFAKDRMINKRNRFSTQELLYSELKGWSFTKKSILHLMTGLDVFIGILAFLVIIWFIVCKIIYALFLSIIGLIMNSFSKNRLSYSSLLAICVYALTFPMILFTVKIFVPGGIPFFALFYFVLAVVYVWIGVRASAANEFEAETMIPPTSSTLSE